MRFVINGRERYNPISVDVDVNREEEGPFDYRLDLSYVRGHSSPTNGRLNKKTGRRKLVEYR